MSLKIAVLVSGGGRTFLNILDEIDKGNLNASVQVLISSNSKSPALDFAQDKGISTEFISWKTHGVEKASNKVYALCDGCDVIVTAGFLKFLHIKPEWEGRVVNIHPSLLPAHGGQGFYGNRVHMSVLAEGDKVSGCTVHLCDNEYDHGDIIEQIEVPVMKDDTVETLAARVFNMEKVLMPRVLQSFATGVYELPFKGSEKA